MDRKTVSGIMLILLLTSILAFNVQSVKSNWTWTGTVYIRADGSVEPSDAPISTVDNVTYTLTDNIVGNVPYLSIAIFVQRNNIVVDGAGYTVQGTGKEQSIGMLLDGRSNVTIKNMTITTFWYGIRFSSSSNNSIVGNNITNNGYGIYVDYSSNNSIVGNNITANTWYGIELYYSSNSSISGNNATNNRECICLCSSSNSSISGNNIMAYNRKLTQWYSISLMSSSGNSIFHNNFINNVRQVHSINSTNVWDDGYPSGGNYWSDYTGLDIYSGPYQNKAGSDGIGDTPYIIDAYNRDHYPLMLSHDVAITYVMPSKTVVGQGYNLNINVTVANQGDFAETFNVTAYVNTTEIGKQTITLTNGTFTSITFLWNTSGFVKGSYTISAYAWTVPYETDLTDNNCTDGTIKVTMPGDCYTDGKININDMVYVARAYGTKIGQPKYNPNADINNDGKININDLIAVARNYGKKDP